MASSRSRTDGSTARRRQARALGAVGGRQRGTQAARAGAAARAGVRRAIAVRPRHPAPVDVQERWRARGTWTDETLLDRLDTADDSHLALVDGDVRLTIDELRTRSARVAAALRQRGVRPDDVVCWQLPNWWEAVVLCWAIWRCGAIASPITPTLRPRARLHPRPNRCPAGRDTGHVSGTDHAALLRDAGYAGDALVVRGDEPLPETTGEPPAVDAHVDDAAVILWTSGTTSDPKGVVHTHQSLRVEADTIAAAHDMRPGESLLLPMPITHVAGLTYGPLLPVTSAITAVLMDTWEPGRALELLQREAHRGDDLDAGVHAHDDRPSLRLQPPTCRACACSRWAERASRRQWSARARRHSTAGANAPTAPPNTRR